MKKTPFILSIDDDKDINALVEKYISKFGYNVLTKTDAKEFLSTLKNRKEEVDLCLIDLNLNEMKGAGYQMISAIRKVMGGKIPIIVMSSRDSKEDIEYALSVGADDYISKPLTREVLSLKLGQYLGNTLKSTAGTEKFYIPPLDFRECDITIDMNVIEINEFSILMKAKHYISRGARVTLFGILVEEIFGEEFASVRINECLPIEGNAYKIRSDFDANNTELLGKVRAWILKKKTQTLHGS